MEGDVAMVTSSHHCDVIKIHVNLTVPQFVMGDVTIVIWNSFKSAAVLALLVSTVELLLSRDLKGRLKYNVHSRLDNT